MERTLALAVVAASAGAGCTFLFPFAELPAADGDADADADADADGDVCLGDHDTEREHNDTWDQANVLCDIEHGVEIQAAGDDAEDWFRLVQPSGSAPGFFAEIAGRDFGDDDCELDSVLVAYTAPFVPASADAVCSSRDCGDGITCNDDCDDCNAGPPCSELSFEMAGGNEIYLQVVRCEDLVASPRYILYVD